MSMIKRALFPGERDGELLVHVVEPGKMIKTASSLAPGIQEFVGCLEPDPRYTYVLSNAMGYSQFYGANSNTDWYGYNPHLNFDGLLNAWPDIGQNIEADRMKGKNWPYGYPAFYGATVYAHHKNTDPQRLGFGDVIYASANAEMKRIELVERVFNDEARKKGHESILHRIRAGERVDVSMGAKIPFDLDSITTDWDLVKEAWKTFDPKLHRHPGVAILHYHKNVRPIPGLAVTRADYSTYMKTMRGKILPDGRKVFVYNDFPRFFDISFVWIGADRTARVMWFLGEEGDNPTPKRQSTAFPGALERFLKHMLSRQKLSMMEKEIPDGVAQAVHTDANSMAPMHSGVLRVVGKSPKPALSALAALGIILRPEEFTEAMTGKSGISFDPALGGIDGSCAIDAGDVNEELVSALSPLAPARSGFSRYLNLRLSSTPRGAKVASGRAKVARSPMLDKMAAQYNGYRLSVLEKGASVFGKKIASTDQAGALGSDGVFDPGADLLLGAGSVIHFTASHLPGADTPNSPMNKISNYSSDSNPQKLASVGSMLRTALESEKVSGLVDAASKIVTAAEKIL